MWAMTSGAQPEPLRSRATPVDFVLGIAQFTVPSTCFELLCTPRTEYFKLVHPLPPAWGKLV